MTTSERMWLIGLFGVALFALSLQARAQDKVLNFEDLAPGMIVKNQYAGQGVEFAKAPPRVSAFGGIPPMIFQAAGQAHSGTHVLSISHGGGEFYSSELWARFTIGRKKVSMFVGDLARQSAEVLLTIYSADGKEISHTQVSVGGGNRVQTPIGIEISSPTIHYFHVTDAKPEFQYSHLAIDDLTFDVPSSPPPPDFSLDVSLVGNAQLLPGKSFAVPLVLERFNLSSGDISLSVSGLPPGVSGKLTPNPVAGPNPRLAYPAGEGGDSATLNLSGAPGAVLGQAMVTVAGTPSSPRAGPGPRSVQFTLIVVGTYTLRLRGIELTQGTQQMGVPSRGPDPSAPIAYSGVQLSPDKPTLLRVFADAWQAPAGGVSAWVLLHGYDSSNRELANSPISPVSAPTLIDRGSGYNVLWVEQITANASFDFMLPWSWSIPGPLTLKAELFPPVSLFDHSETAVPFNDPSCLTLRTLTMTGISFSPLPQPFVYIDPVLLHVDGQPDPPDPDTAFAMAKLVTPTSLGIPSQYVGTVDITDYANESFKDASSDSWHELEDWWDDVGGQVGVYTVPAPYFTIGVTGKLDIGVTEAEEGHPIAVTFSGRPLTSVTHELHHCFGRMHASSACNATGSQAGEPWPPDQQGFLNGVGIDMRGLAPFKTMQATLAAGFPGAPSQWFDFMGYCAVQKCSAGTEACSWISPKGWNEFWYNPNTVNLGSAASGQSRVMATLTRAMPRPAAQPASAPVGETLRVRAYVSDTGVHISIVKKVPNGHAFAPPTSSPYHLLVRDATGRTITEVAMATKEVSVLHRAIVTLLRAEVPTKPGIESVAIAKDGKVVAQRARPQQLPQVKVFTPQVKAAPVGALPGREGSVLIQWQALASTQNRVTASVDYSLDDGRTWRVLYKGPNRNQVQLPQHYFAGSPKARVRVRISDGFNEVSAVSNSFAAPSLPPTVRILEPSPNAKLKSGMPVRLIGKAADERMKPIPDASLHWFRNDLASRREISLGTGERLLVPSLPPGPNVIRLEARDAQGRVASARVEVNVAGNPAQFIVLDSPRLVSASARQVVIRVASSLPATLTIQQVARAPVSRPPTAMAVSPGTRVATPPSLLVLASHIQRTTLAEKVYQVGRQPMAITLDIPAERKPLFFSFSLKAEGLATTRMIGIGRN